MGIPGLPFDHSVAGVEGAAVDTAISLPGLEAGGTVLAVIEHDAGSTVAGLDPGAFTVSAGEIESASLDTSGSFLKVIYTNQ